MLDHAYSYGNIAKVRSFGMEYSRLACSDGNIIHAYRAKLLAEVKHYLNPNIATRIFKVTISMPLNVFVYIFPKYPIKICKIMFTFKAKGCDGIPKILDDDWDKIMPALCIVRLSMK